MPRLYPVVLGPRLLGGAAVTLTLLSCAGPDPVDDTGRAVDSGHDTDVEESDTEDTADTGTYVDSGPPPRGGPCQALGFEMQPLVWEIPYRADLLNNSMHGFHDLTGDGRPDFVQKEPEWSSTGVDLGWDYWRVFANNGARFVTPAQEWSVPNTQSTSNAVTDRLSDFDGDGLIDMLRTRNDGEAPNEALSVTEWHLYRNNGSGFDVTPVSWPIPVPASVTVPYVLQMIDLTGDGLLDLVRMAPRDGEEAPALGQTEWWVHVNSGAGFDPTPLAWSLPIPTDQLFKPMLSLLEVTGDGKLDLVQSKNLPGQSDAALGQTEWWVFENTGSGFAPRVSWSIPVPTTHISLYQEVFDIDQDGLPEFVQTTVGAQQTSATLGETEWWVFRNTGSGFESVSESWPIPYPMTYMNTGSHTVADMNGDGFADLVQHYGEGGSPDASIGVDDWRVFLSRCGG